MGVTRSPSTPPGRSLDRPRRSRARARAARRTALRGAARMSDRDFDLDDDGRLTGDLLHKTDPEVMECFSPFTDGQRHRLAASRRRADDVPRPAAERLERPHLPARADPRRRARSRADHPDRQRGRTTAIARLDSGAGARARVRGARRSPGRLLGSRGRNRADRAGTRPRAPFDGAFADPAKAGQARPRRPASLSGSPARSASRGGAPLPPCRVPQVLATDFARAEPGRARERRRARDRAGRARGRSRGRAADAHHARARSRSRCEDPRRSRSSSRWRTARNVSRAGARSRHARGHDHVLPDARHRPEIWRLINLTERHTSDPPPPRRIPVLERQSATVERPRTESRPEARAPPCASAVLPRTASRTCSTTTSSA